MSNESRKPISEKQAAARRENGKKSGGPVTAEGKRRSSQNSSKHGYWARQLGALRQGPLREDPDEIEQFVLAVMNNLNPADHFLLCQAAFDVGDKLWRLTRAQRWEVHGYSRPDGGGEHSYNARWMLRQAGEDRKAAAVVRQLPDPSISAEDLWNPFCRLAFHFGASEESLYDLEEADAPTKMETLLVLIDSHFDDIEEAACLLDALATDGEREAEAVYSFVVPDVVRGELDGFAKNAERMVAHASRELDRSFSRFRDLKDRLGDASEEPDIQDDGPDREEGPPSGPPSASGDGGPSGIDSLSSLFSLEGVLDELLRSESSVGTRKSS